MKNVHMNVLIALKKLVATKDIYVFVYAALLNPKIRKKLLKRDPETFVDKLIGFREVSVDSIDGENYHTILPDKSYVMGRRFKVTPKELQLLDRYEGHQYLRRKMKLKSDTIAWVYFLKTTEMKNEGKNLKF